MSPRPRDRQQRGSPARGWRRNCPLLAASVCKTLPGARELGSEGRSAPRPGRLAGKRRGLREGRDGAGMEAGRGEPGSRGSAPRSSCGGRTPAAGTRPSHPHRGAAARVPQPQTGHSARGTPFSPEVAQGPANPAPGGCARDCARAGRDGGERPEKLGRGPPGEAGVCLPVQQSQEGAWRTGS